VAVSTAAAGVLASNYWWDGAVGRIGPDRSVHLLAARGTVTVYSSRTDFGDTPHWFAHIWQAQSGTPGGFRWDGLGFGYAVGRTSGGNVIDAWTIPHWFVILAFGSWPAARWIRRRRFAKRHPGGCRVCGYDLRATPDRCPECGAAAAG